MDFKLSVVYFVLLFITFGNVVAKPKELILYSGPDETGTHFERRGTKAKYLADYNFDDKASSICATGI